MVCPNNLAIGLKVKVLILIVVSTIMIYRQDCTD